MTLFRPTAALAAAFALALAGTALAQDEPMTSDPAMAAAPDASFEQLDTDADGYLVQSDIPVEHELSARFAIADSNHDARLSRDEYNAFEDQPEEEEAEE